MGGEEGRERALNSDYTESLIMAYYLRGFSSTRGTNIKGLWTGSLSHSPPTIYATPCHGIGRSIFSWLFNERGGEGEREPRNKWKCKWRRLAFNHIPITIKFIRVRGSRWTITISYWTICHYQTHGWRNESGNWTWQKAAPLKGERERARGKAATCEVETFAMAEAARRHARNTGHTYTDWLDLELVFLKRGMSII